MSEPFIGEVRAVSWGIIPRGWAPCNGALLGIAQNQALFSILGTTYGGDGIRTFALPDLRGRVAVGGGGTVVLGEVAGTEHVTVLVSAMPAHNHPLVATSTAANDQSPGGDILGGNSPVYGGMSAPAVMAPQTLGVTGGTQPHNNIQPCLAINYIIATTGIFPSRS